MALTDTDRRRFTAATVLTLLALPALWLANTSDNSAAPNLAVAGIDPDVENAEPAEEPSAASAADPTPAVDDGLGDIAPVYLEGPSSAAGAGQSPIAIPSRPLLDVIAAKATFRSTVPAGTCIVGGITTGSQITVVNLDNNRSMTCTTILAPGDQPRDVVMHTDAFAGIADLTDAPISVEIRR
jgi:hypothetical protein